MNRYVMGMAAIIVMACAAGNSYADRRSFVWTYEYSTMPAGVAEAEYYLTVSVPDKGARESSTWQHQVELEYGLTDNLDVGMYQVFEQNYKADGSSEFKYDGFKVKARYKLPKSIVDPLLYVEYERNSNLAEPDLLEAKLVLAKDLGSFRLAYNQIVEAELGGEHEVENEFAAGASYSTESGLSAGLEAKGSYTEDEYAVGPVLSFETKTLWVTFGTVFGLNSTTADIEARMIAGFAF